MTISYSELVSLESFDERLAYASLVGQVCKETFGADRIFNQKFYHSADWRRVRNFVIVRDRACDLAVDGREVSKPYIHHLNPINVDDIREATDQLLDPENLIVVSFDTHNIIHYGDESVRSMAKLVERRPNDTCPWKNPLAS